jgi:hypothetical protein
MISSASVVAALVAAVVALLTALITALVTVGVAERRLRRDYRLEFATESVARELMSDPKWEQRSFEAIQSGLGGFAEDDLRRILVKAGAIRFTVSGREHWGLLARNRERL